MQVFIFKSIFISTRLKVGGVIFKNIMWKLRQHKDNKSEMRTTTEGQSERAKKKNTTAKDHQFLGGFALRTLRLALRQTWTCRTRYMHNDHSTCSRYMSIGVVSFSTVQKGSCSGNFRTGAWGAADSPIVCPETRGTMNFGML